jgi:hypothetical protein
MDSTPIEIEVFQAGKRTASNGVTFNFSIEDLKQVVETFNPSIFRPPLIVSHEIGGMVDGEIADKELCYGIPKYLRLVGDRLKAGFEKIAPQMVEWVRNGQLHSVSSSFYLPNSPNNPYPGKLSLRHIACLGNTPPAVKGLAPLELCEFNVYQPEEGVVNFMMYSPWVITADLFQRFREYLIEKDSLEVAEQVLPSDQIALLRTMGDSTNLLHAEIAELRMRLNDLEMNEDEPIYMEMMDYKALMKAKGMSAADVSGATEISEEDIKAFVDGSKKPSTKQKKLLDELLGENSTEMSEAMLALIAREKAIAAKELEFERKEIASFVEGLIKQGKIIAAKRDDTVTLLALTPHNVNVEFASSGSKSPRQALMDMLNDQPSWNYGEELVTPLAQIPMTPNFNAPSGFGVDKRKSDEFRRAIAFCQANNLDSNNSQHWQEALEQTQRGVNA